MLKRELRNNKITNFTKHKNQNYNFSKNFKILIKFFSYFSWKKLFADKLTNLEFIYRYISFILLLYNLFLKWFMNRYNLFICIVYLLLFKLLV